SFSLRAAPAAPEPPGREAERGAEHHAAEQAGVADHARALGAAALLQRREAVFEGGELAGELAVLGLEMVVLGLELAEALDGEGLEAAVGESLVAVGVGAYPLGEDLFDLLGDHADLGAGEVGVLGGVFPLVS